MIVIETLLLVGLVAYSISAVMCFVSRERMNDLMLELDASKRDEWRIAFHYPLITIKSMLAMLEASQYR